MLTTDGLAGRDLDTEPLTAALHQKGYEADAPVWHDESVDWAAYDLLIIRTPWDYPERYAEFMAWLDRAAGLTRILNAPELIRWNIDKRYLADFPALGVDVIPTTFCDTVAEAAAAIDALTTGRLVVKPSVSASSRDTGLFAPGDIKAIALAERIIAAGKTAMIQPAAESVIEGGENALFYFNGRFAYAVHKGPILATGGGYLNVGNKSEISRTEASRSEIDLGDRVLTGIAQLFAGEAGRPLYARVDIAVEGVLEVEVFEPAYSVGVAPEAVGAFVSAVGERLG